MNYSINTSLHPYANADGLHKIIINVVYRRMKVYVPTPVRVPKNNFLNGKVVKHEKTKQFNILLSTQKHEIEERLLSALTKSADITKTQLSAIAKGVIRNPESVEDFINHIITINAGRLSEGRLKHYTVMKNKMIEFTPGLKFADINLTWLQSFENFVRSSVKESNTVQSNMTIVKSILNKAEVADFIDKKQYNRYKAPKYQQKIPDYITEAEMAKLYDLLQAVEDNKHKLAGYYFLLSCYSGLRLSDLKAFNYDERVREGKIILRAKKNGEIVSISIHTRLSKILDYIHDKPLNLSEQKMRDYVKDMAKLIGINRNVKIHTARHSFAMMLMNNNFSIDEVAELIGDSAEVAKAYARITNKSLDKKIQERLG